MGKCRSKKNRNKRNDKQNAPKQQASQATKPPRKQAEEPKAIEIRTLRQQAQRVSDRPPAESAAIGPRPAGTELDDMWTLANEAKELFEDATKSARKARDAAEEERREYERKQGEVQKQQSALDQQHKQQEQRDQRLTARSSSLNEKGRKLRAAQAEHDEREQQLASERDALTRRETDIKARELNAEAGFSKEREEMLVQLDERARSLRATIEELETDNADKRAAWHREAERERAQLDQELRERRAQHTAELDQDRARSEKRLRERERELDEREKSLREGKQALAKEHRELGWERDEIEEYKAGFNVRVQRHAAQLEEKYQHQIAMLERQLEQARADRDTHAATLMAREEADRRFGQRTPDEVLQELQQARATNDRLREELARRPDEDAALRLDHLDAEKKCWQAERHELIGKLNDNEARLARLDAAQLEIATREEQIANLEKTRDALQQSALELRQQVDSLISHADAQTAFPACQAMDDDGELQNKLRMDARAVDNLDDFVRDLQQRIAWDPDHPEQHLYYSLDDLRSFVAGLAMGSLVLLQGISGTGKTSLPIAFARAVGTRATVVEVQAGWRDPQDLVGHYNAFEKRYYEREFLQALYRAQTPRWRDAVHIVVLDEMNLSHPEQYFSDMLSALERQPEDRRLVLMSHALKTAPALFRHGRELAIPANVWFVGVRVRVDALLSSTNL